MRRTASNLFGIAAIVAVAILLVMVGLWKSQPVCQTLFRAVGTALAQTGQSGNSQSAADTAKALPARSSTAEDKAAAETKKADKPGKGTVNIRIDESGISIEGSDEGGEADTSGSHIIIDKGEWSGAGDKWRYKEKGEDIVRFGEDVAVSKEDLVRGDVVVFGGDASIEGKVVGDVVVIMGNARVASGAEINGNMVVIGGTLDEQPEVIIQGERVVLKDLKFSLGKMPFGFKHDMGPFYVFSTAAKFLVCVVLFFLVLFFLRNRVIRSHEHIVSGVMRTFGTGFLVAFIGVFVIPVLFLILLVTIIGIPLALVLVASCIAIFFVADTVFAYTLGSKVRDRFNFQTTNAFAIVLLGTAVLFLPGFIGFGFSLVPFGGFLSGLFKVLGVLLGIFAFLSGLGALFLSRFGGRGVPARAPSVNPTAPMPPAAPPTEPSAGPSAGSAPTE